TTMIIYIKNERGVAYPLFCNEQDKIEEIWKEIRVCTSINDRSIVGKRLVSQEGRELSAKDRLEDVGISHFHVIRLMK
ncbi:hypothetical protein PFISCL1PPCAC_1429, partial [Pristionchus fissidentatus]